MQRTILLCFILLIGLSPLLSQRALTIEDLNRWQSIRSEKLSADGRWLTYVLQPDNGDRTVLLYDSQTEREWRFERSDQPRFNLGSTHLVFVQHPAQDSLKAMRRRKVKKKDLPGDTLAVLSLASEQLLQVPNFKSYQLPEKWDDWLAYGIETPLPDSLTKGIDKDAYRLVFHQLSTGDTLFLEGVMNYRHAEEGPAFLASVAAPDSIQSPGVYYFDAATATLQPVLPGKGDYQQMSLSRTGKRVAFLADQDTTEERIRPFELYRWEKGEDIAVMGYANRADWMPDGWRISENGRLSFSHDESRLFFGIAPDPILPDTGLLDEEIVQVEVWTTADDRMYTRAENELNSDRRRTYLCLHEWASGRTLQLGTTEQAEIQLANRGDARYALATDDRAYRYRRSFEGWPGYQDFYLLDLTNGDRTLIAEGIRGNAQWSPNGSYVMWYNVLDTAYYSYSIADGQTRQLTNNAIAIFHDEEHDSPSPAGPYGRAGWQANDAAVYLYDRYDWWKVNPAQALSAQRLTNLRAAKRSARYLRLDPEKRFFSPGDQPIVYLFDDASRESGYGRLDLNSGSIETLQMGPYSFSRQIEKAKNADRYLYTKANFRTFPDLIYGDDLQSGTTISKANPQQSEYRWGDVELVQWTSLDGQVLEGMLVKPDDFDPTKQYPMIVNFYERSSNGLFRHRAPSAGRSTINYSYYVSRGYLIFNPDVPYRIGYPGESAYNAVVSGVTALMNKGFVDPDRIGVQGHSWGGYQIAHLVTETDLFACAESGAPVVNMISAYGGIRWGSGLVRQFQYEQTQSRIGGTPWEYPMRYLENSPIFFIDKINTPVLIMHNDKDGAVPWYQGIEFFAALRRLNKPAWMLNYNGEPHWPLKYQNRVDFQTRMSQFFDYYLMDGPKPLWMEKGVSPIEKGIRQNYEPSRE